MLKKNDIEFLITRIVKMILITKKHYTIWNKGGNFLIFQLWRV